VEDSDSDDGRVDARLDRQDLADQGAQSQSPSVGVRVVAFVEVDLGVVRRLLVGKGLCSHRIVVAGAVAAELDVVGVVDVDVDADAADAADAVDAADVDDAAAAAELVVVQQSNPHAVTCIEHELRQHDDVLQLVPLLHEPCPQLLWLCDGPTIPPYS
jgi:hypothetical protein